MKVLLVEDDRHLAEALAQALTEHRYVVDVAPDGQAGWGLVTAFAYDLVLLDVVLPKLDGISLCRRLRSQGYQLPILLLTAQDASSNKVMGLDAGADDYLVKPLDLQELAARMRALLRRGSSTLPPILAWNGLFLDPIACKVRHHDQPLQLTPKEYSLLELFLRNSGRVFSRGVILDHLWSAHDQPEEDTVKSHIKSLRQKLKTAGAPADLIETVYGLGYRLKPLSPAEDQTHKVLVAGLPNPLAVWLQRRLGRVWLQVTHTGTETLAQLEQEDWSLLILDHSLTHPPVPEVVKQIRSHSKLARLPIIHCVTQGVQDLPSGQILFHPLDPEVLAHRAATNLGLVLPPAPNKSEQTITAVAKLWERVSEGVSDRLAILEQAATALLAGTFSESLRQQAEQEAHQLAGSLGTFGYPQGSCLAQEMETLLPPHASLNPPQVLRFCQLMTALRRELHSTFSSAPPLRPVQQPLLWIVSQDPKYPEPLLQEAAAWGIQALGKDLFTTQKTTPQEIPEVVVLDLDATDQAGWILLAQLTNQLPPILVLGLTSEPTLTKRLEVARLGGCGCLPKTLPPVQVLQEVNRVLQQRYPAETKVMIVDDDPQVLMVLKTLLESRGLKVIGLDNPEQFWEKLPDFVPDLLILDVEMPEVSGIELCQIIRSDRNWRRLPILCLTTELSPTTLHQVLTAGADDCLSKPLAGSQLITRIFSCLQRTRLR